MKYLIGAVVGLSLIGAGCAPAAAPMPVPPAATSTSQTPTVPEYAQDWLTYTSRQFGFSFRYPKFTGQTLPPKQIDLGTAVSNPGTLDVPNRWMEIKLLRSDDPSLKNHYYAQNGWDGDQTDVKTVTMNGLTWYVHDEGDAGAGNYYYTRSYVTLIGYTHVVLSFTVHSVACENYGDDWQSKCVKFDEDRDTAVFDQIVGTYLPKQE